MVLLHAPLVAPLETALPSHTPPLPSPITQASKRTLGHVQLVSLLGGNDMDTFGCPAGTVDCGGSCTSTAEGRDAWCGAEAGGAAARLGQHRSPKTICESAQRGWREGGAVSLFGLSAQHHWLTWDHARSRSRAEVLLLLAPALLTVPVVPQARGMLTAPQQHIKNCS